MKYKLEKILKKIKSGQVKNISDIKLTLTDYLTKDENGISFLEHLLKNNIDFNYWSVDGFKNSVEAGYIYCKCDEGLYSFDFSEEDLFSEIDGKVFIDFIAKTNTLLPSIVEQVKNHIEIIDIIVSNAQYWTLGSLSQELLSKLLIKNSNGVFPIEKYLDNENVIKYLMRFINKSEEIIEILRKNDKYDLLKYANEKVLLHKIDEEKTLFQDLLEKDIIPEILNQIPEDINFINYLRDNNFYEYLKGAKEDVLLLEVNPGITLLEDMLQKGHIPKNFYLSKKKTINILYSQNKLDLINNISESKCLLKCSEIFENSTNEQTFLDYMLDMGYNPLNDTYNITKKEIIEIFYKRGYYDFLGKKLDEDYLSMEIEEGISLIDKLLENNVKDIKFGFNGFSSEKTAGKLYNKNRLDLLIKGELSVLLTEISPGYTYFDHILKNIKEKNFKYNLNKFLSHSISLRERCEFYLYLAKYDMMEYVDELKEEDLLKEYEEKTLLDGLLDLNSELTLNKVIPKRIRSKMKIAIILKSRGLLQQDIDVPLDKNNFTNRYLENFQNTLGIGPLLNEGEVLINKLYDLFIKDGKSDKSLINTLISGYRHSLLVNYETNIKELRNLVEIKENNFEKFILVKENEGAFFRQYTGSVHCDKPVVETMLHETGHALHHYLADSKAPEEYENIVSNLRRDKKVLDNVKLYSEKYDEIRKQIFSHVEKKYELFFERYYTDEKKKEIEILLGKSQMEKLEEFKDLGVSEDVLKTILGKTFTTEEYIKHQKRLYIRQYSDAMIRSKFGAFMAIGDILDAIYEGELYSGELTDKTGEKIKETAGHGISYYYEFEHRFDEIIANFAFISKSKDSKEMLNLLNLIIGDELYKLISEFYYEKIVKYNEEKPKSL